MAGGGKGTPARGAWGAEGEAAQAVAIGDGNGPELGHDGCGHRADEHHRPEDVDEQREVPAVRPDARKQAGHAPGFQIMSMRSSRIRTLLTVWNWNARDARNVSATTGLVSVPACARRWASMPAAP